MNRIMETKQKSATNFTYDVSISGNIHAGLSYREARRLFPNKFRDVLLFAVSCPGEVGVEIEINSNLYRVQANTI